MRDPEWFLAKIEAGLEAAGIPPETPSPVRKLSRAEINSIVTATLNEELARLEARQPEEPEIKSPAGPVRRTDP
jgi:hypothetical protein